DLGIIIGKHFLVFLRFVRMGLGFFDGPVKIIVGHLFFLCRSFVGLSGGRFFNCVAFGGSAGISRCRRSFSRGIGCYFFRRRRFVLNFFLVGFFLFSH